MEDDKEADAAIEKLNGSELDGRTIAVNEARPKEDRPRRDFGDRGGDSRSW
jgi:RNA recognition motif-containing protein